MTCDGAQPFRHVPIPLAIEALRDGSIDRWATKIRRILWARMPQQIRALIDELAASDPVERHLEAGDTGKAAVRALYADDRRQDQGVSVAIGVRPAPVRTPVGRDRILYSSAAASVLSVSRSASLGRCISSTTCR